MSGMYRKLSKDEDIYYECGTRHVQSIRAVFDPTFDRGLSPCLAAEVQQ